MEMNRVNTGAPEIAAWSVRLVDAVMTPAEPGNAAALVEQAHGLLGDDACGRAVTGALGAIDAIRSALA